MILHEKEGEAFKSNKKLVNFERGEQEWPDAWAARP